MVDDIRPVLERENLGPARDAIHELFMEHVMAHAPGYKTLMNWTEVPIPLTSSGIVTITPGSPSDHVSVAIPDLGVTVFARLNVSEE